jgi:6-phosphogluconolactonase
VDSSIKIFQTPYELAETFAEEMVEMVKQAGNKKKPFTIALSGGSTPELLFSLLGDHFADKISWKSVHLFWGDERCVPPDHNESNFGMTKRKFIDNTEIPFSNIHRIRGEADPESEAVRYSEEIKMFTGSRNTLPLFDLVILGLGDDGHTASIFPGHNELLTSPKICEVAYHPLTHQRRITITGRVINNSERVVFLVTGSRKAEIVENIINKKATALNYPAAYIVPFNGSLTWYVDKEAAALL